MSTTIVRDFPGESDVKPTIVRVSTDSTFSQVTAPGFLKNTPNIAGQEIFPTDIIAVSYSDGAGGRIQGIFQPHFLNGVITLIGQSGDVVDSVTGTANQIVASPTKGDVVLSIPDPFITPGVIKGNYHSVRDVSANTYIGQGFNDANGIINCTNSGSILLGLNASIAGITQPGYAVEIYMSGTGTVGFFTGGSDTMTIVPQTTTLVQGGKARIELIAIDGGGNGSWAVNIINPYITYSSSTYQMTGPWSSAQNAYISLTNIGGSVTMTLGAISATLSTASTNLPLQSNVAIPAAFRPSSSSTQIVGALTVNSGTGGIVTGSIYVSSAGVISIFSSPDTLATPQYSGTSGVTAVGYMSVGMGWSI